MDSEILGVRNTNKVQAGHLKQSRFRINRCSNARPCPFNLSVKYVKPKFLPQNLEEVYLEDVTPFECCDSDTYTQRTLDFVTEFPVDNFNVWVPEATERLSSPTTGSRRLCTSSWCLPRSACQPVSCFQQVFVSQPQCAHQCVRCVTGAACRTSLQSLPLLCEDSAVGHSAEKSVVIASFAKKVLDPNGTSEDVAGRRG